jgi:hypothetical protein
MAAPPEVFRVDLGEGGCCAKLIRCQSLEQRAAEIRGIESAARAGWNGFRVAFVQGGIEICIARRVLDLLN